jgi:hypothetical protein
VLPQPRGEEEEGDKVAQPGCCEWPGIAENDLYSDKGGGPDECRDHSFHHRQ